ncbi:MAG: MucR family transcriptional regulator [Magnetococcus sp. DMHC-8]
MIQSAEEPGSLVQQTAEIVKAYLSRNALPPHQVADLIETVHRALLALSRDVDLPVGLDSVRDGPTDVVEQTVFVPFVPVEQAVTEESVICLVCGKAGKAIRGHITRTHGLDIPTYLAQYGLPDNFPLVAPAYSATRRRLALAAGAGEKLQTRRARAGRRG